jgi:hypothetical protein
VRWKIYALVFLATAIAGLAIRMYGQDIVIELFGEGWFILTFLAPTLILPAFVAAVVGYVLPRGFFLWGIAVIFLHPLVEAWQTHLASAGGGFRTFRHREVGTG